MVKPARGSWQEFEDLVERIHRAFHPSAKVTCNEHILGVNSQTRRQIDVSIRYKLGLNQVLMIVECKRHRRKVDIGEMNAFVGTVEDVRANLGILVSEEGFTKAARRIAERRGIKTYTLRDTRRPDWPGNIATPIFVESCTIEPLGYWIKHADGTPVELAPDTEITMRDFHSQKEFTLADLISRAWRDRDKEDGEFWYEYPLHQSLCSTNPPWRFLIGFKARTVRFKRVASMQLLGLLDVADGVTHTQNFNIITDPGVDAVLCPDRSLWMRGEDAPFAIQMEAVHIEWEKLDGVAGEPTPQQIVTANLDKLQIAIGAKFDKEPFFYSPRPSEFQMS